MKEHYKEIDLILLDLMIPDIYGLNLLAEINQDPALRKIPMILQAGSSDNAKIERAFELGIVTYIKKPYQKQNIMYEIDQAYIANLKQSYNYYFVPMYRFGFVSSK